MSTIHVKTETGFECDVDENIGNDFEVLDYLSQIQIKQNPLYYPLLVEKMIGPAGKAALTEHVRAGDGFVSDKDIGKEIADIFNSIKGGKN